MSKADWLADIHQQSFPAEHAWSAASFDELLIQSGAILYDDHHGFLLVRCAADEMEVLTIAVLPEYRRGGIAAELMERALYEAKKSGITCCFLEVDCQNQPAIKLYERLGFTVVATRKNYYQAENGKSDALLMRYRFAT